MKKLFALSVGIDQYLVAGNLGGCEQDVKNISKFLHERFKDQLYYRSLINQEATREGIIDGIRAHLGKAGPEDAVLFHFSGHGTRAYSPVELQEPDGKHEGLVCHDTGSRKGDNRVFELADKEIRVLLYELTERGAYVTVILDCCYSGSGTRDKRKEVQFRRWNFEARSETNSFERPLCTFMEGYYMDKIRDYGVEIPSADYVVLSACSFDEKAGETSDGGLFTSSLLRVLHSEPGPRLADLFCRIRNHLRQQSKCTQTPHFELYGRSNPYAEFLTGKSMPCQQYPKIKYLSNAGNTGWALDMGALHGLNLDGIREWEISVVGTDASDTILGYVKVNQIGLEQSELEILGDLRLDTNQTYFAIVMPYSIGVHLSGERAPEIRTVILKENNWLLEDIGAKYEVVATTAAYKIQLKGKISLLTGIESSHVYALSFLSYHLGQIAKWEHLRSIKGPEVTILDPTLIELNFYTLNNEEIPKLCNDPYLIEDTVDLVYHQLSDGSYEDISYKITVRNKLTIYDKKVYFYLLYFGRKFEIQLVWADEPQAGWSRSAEIPLDEHAVINIGDPDIDEVDEYFLLFASTIPLTNTYLFSQEGLSSVWQKIVSESEEPGIHRARVAQGPLIDWTVKRLNIKTKRVKYQSCGR
ncbi:MAG: caspase family protein [Bacteroidota bacterium]